MLELNLESLFMQGTNLLNITIFSELIFSLICFYLVYLLCLSLFVFTFMLILRLLLCSFVFESLVAHAPLFAN